MLYAIGQAGRFALQGDHRAAWDVYHSGIDEHDELGSAASRLLACVTA